ncbi:unnamed protein product, partial [marine sediment metagenome]
QDDILGGILRRLSLSCWKAPLLEIQAITKNLIVIV